MKESILKFLKLDGLLSTLTEYLEAKVDLLKIEIKEELARFMAIVFVAMLLGLAVSFFLLLLSFGAALYLGNHLGTLNGFLIVCGVYLIIGILLVLYRKQIVAKLEQRLLEIANRKRKSEV